MDHVYDVCHMSVIQTPHGPWLLFVISRLCPLLVQSVLEGLNACLDHRAEVYIPELGRSFRCPPTFKVFAAQNPLGQGGGRKGLPRSFLSRFTKVRWWVHSSRRCRVL